MKRLQIDSVLLFALVTTFIMQYRLSPEETPYLLFGSIFGLLLLYQVLDLLALSEGLYARLKLIILFGVSIAVIGSSFLSAIIVRHQTAPVYMVHDIILQQEAAIRYLLDGKNPYATDYFGTPVEEWHYSDTEINPALYHFVMQPFYLLFSLPFYATSNTLFGYFDGRMPLLFLFAVMLLVAYLVPKKDLHKRLFVILLGFHPSVLPYTLEGRSDVFMFAFLMAGVYLLWRRKRLLAGIPLALAFAVKQSAWPLLPFYALYLLFSGTREDSKVSWWTKLKQLMGDMSLFITTLLIVVLPFVVWDAKSYIDSTILYLNGSLETSYPISGYGFGMVLHQLGIISSRFIYYPFFWWQFVFGVPLFILLARYLRRKTTLHRLLVSYGIFLFVYWYFSRYFNNSHVAYLSMVFITAYFWPNDSITPKSSNTS